MLRAFIVDDEPSACDRLRDLLEKQRDVEVVGESADVPGALAAIRESPAGPPDVVFLDVQMPGANGFQLIEAMGARAMPAVVFVTAHEEHALRAFDVDAVDYLLKPFDEERFAAALSRVREELELRALRRGGGVPEERTQRKKPLDRLPLRSAGRVSFLRVDHVEWVDAAHNYVRIHGIDGHTHLVRGAISDLETRLDPERFVRIHRSTIVNVDRVRELELTTHGGYVAILEGGQRLTVSRSFRDRLPMLLGSG
ncbi:MAG TPA: LytTR family DNA-binding domain-containing protein [Thermoanaerobaculia bacterium]|jgi:two-component system LytT family response regulator|nr:LytTR family DNA-binding domain-containing protein [Thermoanaerobaculia bacterium]